MWAAALGETADAACDNQSSATLLSTDLVTKLAARALLLAAQCSKLLSMPPVRESISLTLTRSTVWTSIAAKPWDTEKAHFLISFQMMKHLSGNDACNEAIHDYQLSEINDCHEAYTNAALDIVLGYYCGAGCGVHCRYVRAGVPGADHQHVNPMCNPGVPCNWTQDNENDVSETVTYSSETMKAFQLIGPAFLHLAARVPSSCTLPKSRVVDVCDPDVTPRAPSSP